MSVKKLGHIEDLEKFWKGREAKLKALKLVEDFEEFWEGRHAAEEDIRNGDIYDLDAAIYSFELDPPDSPFQRGYLRQLVKTGSL